MAVLEEYGLVPDPVIEYYKKDVDRTLLREHLKLSPEQRLQKVVAFNAWARRIAARPAATVTPDLVGLIRLLAEAHVGCIIVGGVGANLHGALRTTLALDVV